MTFRYRVRRGAALLFAAVAALLVTALPATAGTAGEYIGSTDGGDEVRIAGQRTWTSLFGIKLENGDTIETYCVELDVESWDGARLVESPWSDYPDQSERFNADPDKVLWILHHSYPSVALDALSDELGVELSKREAIAGTQAAIWHFSNGANLDKDGNSEHVRALYDYLTGASNTGVQEQPAVSLSISPAAVENVAGDKPAGPFTVDTTASEVELTVDGPDGVQIVDEVGEPLSDIADGTKFWLSPPADGKDGTATVKAQAQAEVQAGRLFVGVQNRERPTQTLIVAANTETAAKAQVRASWVEHVPPPTTPPTTTTTTTTVAPTTNTTPSNAFTVPSTTPAPQGGSLPNTGASVLQPLGLGLLLVGAGIAFLLVQRRRSAR